MICIILFFENYKDFFSNLKIDNIKDFKDFKQYIGLKGIFLYKKIKFDKGNKNYHMDI